ncbi:TRAP transporter substrate-binding protein [Marinobacter profundi]|uniref:C4-dicarboxylate ABC transporter substrate-binding protein n=1 Tax=Marinobacter profundi TaxID=2666256 RepID=A0A2G1UJ62_9GAMM|nr:TRAP transporter substrate-binding protein DctP [Marinobacter profundi]PHQ14541.1 C4-dicarboxylate ABC transporter substrate-binding protein [Marinobacter profundi]
MDVLKQLRLAKTLPACALFLSLAAGMTAPQVEARTLNYATPAPPTERPSNDVLRWWAEEVERRTDGSIEIKIHWLQSLIKFKDAARGIQSGIADIGPMSPEYTMAQNPLLAMSQTELGSGDNYVASEAWRRATDDFEPIEQEAARNGLKPIGFYSSGVRVNMSTTRPYLTPDDFKGDKVRLTPRAVSAAAANDWDLTSVNITFTDLYSGMERGTIDGAQSYLYLMAPYKHNEVAKYVVETGIGQSLVPVMMNARVWGSLSAKEKQVIQELEPVFNEKMAKAGLEEAEIAKNLLKTHPKYTVDYHVLTDEQRQLWEQHFAPAIDEYVADMAKRDPAASELHQRFLSQLQAVEQEVREQGYPWDRN